MGWLFTRGSNRRQLIEERTRNWTADGPDSTTVVTSCLARCYRGGVFSGVLWAVWERTFTRKRRGGATDRTLAHLRLVETPTRRRVGLQRYGRVHAPLLLLLPASLFGTRPARNLRRLQGMEGGGATVSRETT